MRNRTVVIAGVLVGARVLAAPAPKQVVPAADVGSGRKVDLPPVPSFELPAAEPGFHTVDELRVGGRDLLDTEIKVKGYVTWVYSCATAIAKPGMTKAQISKSIDDDPTQCERPKFYLGSTKTTPPQSSLWVVDVPRPPNKLEKERLPKADLKNWPAVPSYAVGDYVSLTGRFSLASPHGDRNSDGLLVWKALDHVAPSTAPAGKPLSPRMPPASPAAFVPKAPTKAPSVADQDASTKRFNAGAKAYATKQYDAAVTELQEAIKLWPTNGLAWYTLGGVHIARSAWPAAVDAMQHAVAAVPDNAMYWMMVGYTQYEATVAKAREEQAGKEGKKPEQVAVDLSAVSFDSALPALVEATTLNSGIWRAQYYLGRIYRDGHYPRAAAEAFNRAVAQAPTSSGPWVALCELYRSWRYLEEEIAVCTAGTTVVVGSDSADIWYEVGMGYDDKGVDDKAIDAFTKALDARPTHALAMFQRGQAYFRKKDAASAKRDLEAFLKSGSNNEFARLQATSMLMKP